MLETVYYIGQTIAVVAILATLIALIFQIRQSNRLAKAEMSLAVWVPFNQHYADMSDSDEKADFFYKALRTSESLSEPEKLRLGTWAAVMINGIEALYHLDKQGLSNQTMLLRMREGAESLFISERMRKWW